MADLDLTEATEAAARAFHAFVIDEGHAADEAPVTWDDIDDEGKETLVEAMGAGLRAALPLIERAIGEQLETLDFDALVNGIAHQAAFKARERRVRERVAKDIETEFAAVKRGWPKHARYGREEMAYRTAAHIARGGACVANPKGANASGESSVSTAKAVDHDA